MHFHFGAHLARHPNLHGNVHASFSFGQRPRPQPAGVFQRLHNAPSQGYNINRWMNHASAPGAPGSSIGSGSGGGYQARARAPAMGMGIQPACFQRTGQGQRYGYGQPRVMNMHGGRSMGGGGMPYMPAQPRMQGPPIRTRSQHVADIDAHMDTLSNRSSRWSKVPFDDIRRWRPAVKAWEAQQMQRQQMMGMGMGGFGGFGGAMYGGGLEMGMPMGYRWW